MKYILFITFFTISIFACTGDCLSCHPKLLPTINDDLRHKPMLTCINCHSAEPNKMADCGNDCFGCHPMSKINKPNVREHDVIQECRDCHVGEIEKLFDISNSLNQSNQETLKDFLSK
ncbi:MAG: hypothetical protein OQK48_07570 [Sulfurimonas sp.]|uniref:hypothetical protein n=1 Tax=Sulfurimonas sp. TaxID=2022749 RepID=UPI00262AC156|nr:hypothetical protein [Sulfurimonas sp.]MCW8895963.1 hypothetical protein [Sulfurimonas sp.]MCW8954790.1 hypothetical protein [Sulfurimonas sp.]MCW9067028.1 hypothetical protein [Sulfurimonas sp.]